MKFDFHLIGVMPSRTEGMQTLRKNIKLTPRNMEKSEKEIDIIKQAKGWVKETGEGCQHLVISRRVLKRWAPRPFLFGRIAKEYGAHSRVHSL